MIITMSERIRKQRIREAKAHAKAHQGIVKRTPKALKALAESLLTLKGIRTAALHPSDVGHAYFAHQRRALGLKEPKVAYYKRRKVHRGTGLMSVRTRGGA